MLQGEFDLLPVWLSDCDRNFKQYRELAMVGRVTIIYTECFYGNIQNP